MPTVHAPLDYVWMLLCAALVMLMQAGFCCLESGLSRGKNSINVAAKNLFDFVVSSLVFWGFGFALMFGVSWQGLVGTSGFAVSAEAGSWTLAFLFFQLVFCGTATTIISGAVAERMRFSGYLVVSILVSALVYPVFGHWAWGGAATGELTGWLGKLGFIDFAGSTVVHSLGGWFALAAVLVLGPRRGRFGTGGSAMQGHNYPLAMLGVFLLWFGWFGFNGGSTLGASERIPVILLNTNLAAAAGGAVALAASWCLYKRPDVGMAMNGCLAGLVSITAGCHLLEPIGAVAAGAVGGGLCLLACLALERAEVDDVVGAVPVHGVCGVWGTLAVAMLAPAGSWGEGIGRGDQFLTQLSGALVCFVWSFGLGYVALRLLDSIVPLRVSADEEVAGLNVVEHGASTETIDLLLEMNDQRERAEFTRPVHVEPHTEVGQIAAQYNRVLERVSDEISSREEAAAALRTAEEKYRGIFENALWGIFQTTPDGRYLSANPALARMYGYETAEQLKSELNDISGQLYVDPRRRSDFATLILRDDMVTGFESQIHRRDGKQIWISENARAIRDANGKLLHYEGTVEDITRRKETEELRRETEAAQAANVAKSAFLANMSHEIRTPLNGVIGTLDLMAGTPLDTRQQRYLRVCRSSAQSLLTLINDVLDFSKIEAGKLELSTIDFQLDSLIDDVLEMFASRAQQRGLELAVRTAPDVPLGLRGDPDRLRQVLLNLIGNAVKFTEQGEIVIRVHRERSDSERVRLRFEVSDTGIGIPQERLDRLFRAFSQVDASTTRKYGGTGLGLAISKQLVELMGGQISVTSTTGQGSSFAFTVELGRSTASPTALAPPPSALQGMRVLVVDDNETNRQILEEQLRLWGMTAVVTGDPRGSLRQMRSAVDNGEPFGLAILDHQMPDLDGLQLAAKIRSEPELERTPLLMLTSLGHALSNEEVARRGLSGYITKPVRNSQLLDAIMNAIEAVRRSQRARLDDRANSVVAPMPAAKRPAETPSAKNSSPKETPRLEPDGAGASISRGAARPANAKAAAKARLLLAEDNDVNQLVAAEILERAGYEVLVVGNGKQAVDSLLTEPIDLVLMDCQMPEMDGLEATQLIRQMESDGALAHLGGSLPIVALTANAFDTDRQRCRDAGMNAHVSKPIDAGLLLETIEKQFATRIKPATLLPTEPTAAEPPKSVEQEHPLESPPSASTKSLAKGDALPPAGVPFVMSDLRSRCLGDETLVTRVLGKFLAQLPGQLQQLEAALGEGQLDAAGRLAHGLKGAAANMAATTLREAVAHVEIACREQSFTAASTAFQDVQAAARKCQECSPIQLVESANETP